MRLSASNIFTEKWFKLSQTESDVVTLNSGDKVKLVSDKTSDVMVGQNKVRFVNSVVNGANGLAVGGGVVTCITGVWVPLSNVGFIRIVKDGSDYYADYTGNYPIQIGEVEVGYTCVDSTLFDIPDDFTPPITIPPTQTATFDMSDGVTYPMGEYITVMSGGGRLQEVVVDYVRDPNKVGTSRTPYLVQQSTTTTLSQNIANFNSEYNKSIYTTADGIGELTVNSGFTSLSFQIALTVDKWEVKVQLASKGAGQEGVIQNKINGQPTSGDPATEKLVFRAKTY